VSNLEVAPGEVVGGGVAVGDAPVLEVLAGREVVLGLRGDTVLRTLPHRERRMVGAWCFVDLFGPEDIASNTGMQVPPHPHTGLQTVSWLVRGEILHRDSLGSTQLIQPGQLNLMTAGRGISHAEQSPAEHSAVLHGAQLWVALPDQARDMAPAFAHHADLPTVGFGGFTATVLLGELGGATSPAATYTPIVGAEFDGAGQGVLPLRTDFEYAVLPLSGTVEVAGTAAGPGPLLYLGCGRTELPVRAAGSARFLLLGGEPFGERIVMWWNFVGRSGWAAGTDFGTVRGYAGDPLPAPPLPTTRLKPRGRVR
jgi:redox-sensitive bicupin YhaK (pirin superfamily)